VDPMFLNDFGYFPEVTDRPRFRGVGLVMVLELKEDAVMDLRCKIIFPQG